MGKVPGGHSSAGCPMGPEGVEFASEGADPSVEGEDVIRD